MTNQYPLLIKSAEVVTYELGHYGMCKCVFIRLPWLSTNQGRGAYAHEINFSSIKFLRKTVLLRYLRP